MVALISRGLGRKGGLFDIFLAIILSFITVVCLVVFVFAQNKIQTKLLEQAPNIQAAIGNTTNVTTLINNTVGKVGEAYQTFSWIAIAFIFVYFLCVILSAILVKTHPAWFIAYILFSLLAIIISVYLANTYETLYQTPILASTWLSFMGVNFIMLYLPIWVTIISMVAGVLMYSNMDTGVYQ